MKPRNRQPRTQKIPQMLWIFGLGLWLQSTVFGASPSLQADFVQTTDQLIVDWRISGVPAERVTQVALSLPDDTALVTEQQTYPARTTPSCSLIMVDTSLSMTGRFESRVKPLLATLLPQFEAQQKLALAGFAADMTLLLPFDADQATRQRVLAEMKLAGRRTEFYKVMIEGIALLKTCSGVHAQLIVLSDGDAEDSAYGAAEVKQVANQAGVRLFTLGYKDSTRLQRLVWLADHTQGHYWFEPEALNLMSWLDNAGHIETGLATLANNPPTVNLVVTLDDGSTLQATQLLSWPEQPKPWQRWLNKAGQLLNQYLPWLAPRYHTVVMTAIALLIGLLIGLLLLWPLLRLFSRQPAIPDDADLPQASPQPIAILNYLGGSYSMTRSSIKIRALEDNDLVLDDDTVSRHHAVLDYQDNLFYLTDRGATNPTLLNGKVVNHDMVRARDHIQIGSIELILELPQINRPGIPDSDRQETTTP